MSEKNYQAPDQLPEELVQETVKAPEGESLETLLNAAEEDAPQEQAQQDDAQQKEPGYVRGRINRAVEKALAEQAARLEREFQQRLDQQLAPLRDAMMDRQAEELVRSGEFKSIERAKEYVRLKGGVIDPATETPAPTEQQRDAKGRFTPRQTEDADTRARANLLAQQATKIKQNRGVDVMAAFNADPAIKQKVISGEWDFHDVADHLASGRRMPLPVRTPNGVGAAAAASTIANMTDEQFARLEANLARGHRYKIE